MAGSNLVIDTNIILYATVYGNDIAMEILSENNIFISDITEIELLGYHRLSEEEQLVLKEFISNITVVPINEKIKQKAIEIRHKHNIKTPDAIISATALILDYFLITADQKLQQVENSKIVEFQAP